MEVHKTNLLPSCVTFLGCLTYVSLKRGRHLPVKTATCTHLFIYSFKIKARPTGENHCSRATKVFKHLFRFWLCIFLDLCQSVTADIIIPLQRIIIQEVQVESFLRRKFVTAGKSCLMAEIGCCSCSTTLLLPSQTNPVKSF